MRGIELLTANLAALGTGLLLFFLFRPPQALAVGGLFLAGTIVVQIFQMRRPQRDWEQRGASFRLASLVLNGLYGSFFAALAYFMILAVSGQIGYPYR